MSEKFYRFECESCKKINHIFLDDFQTIKIGSTVYCTFCGHKHYKENHAVVITKTTIYPDSTVEKEEELE